MPFSSLSDFWNQLISNHMIVAGFFGWVIAQIIKTIIHSIVTKKFDFKRFFGDGGMPSAHSSTVTSVTITAALWQGIYSPVFGLSIIFAFITMRDAMGVRLETGKQAIVLNKMLEHMADPDLAADIKLKEFVGHTPTQVIFGGVLGVIIAIVLHNIFPFGTYVM